MTSQLGSIRKVAQTILFFVSVSLSAQTKLADEIAANAIKFKSISLEDYSGAELTQLASLIGDATVVMLGEQTHGDGDTFTAKVSLIRFLHEKMGFNVIAFESDMYALDRVNFLLQSDTSASISNLLDDNVYPIWEKAARVKPLFDYVNKNRKTNPIHLAGFDSKHVLKYSRDYLISDLLEFLNSVKFVHTDKERFARILDALVMREYLSIRLVTESDQLFFFSYLTQIQEYLIKNDSANVKRTTFYKQLLISMEGFAKNSWSVKIGGGDIRPIDKYGNKMGNVRDIYMAKNALWLINEQYKNQKIILWGATLHFARNLSKTDSVQTGVSYLGRVTMGDILSGEIPKRIYSIGFTTYQGSWGDPWMEDSIKIKPAQTGSVEATLFHSQIKFGYLDFKSLPPTSQLKQLKVSMRPLGHIEMKAIWPNILDGVFYIGEMSPSRFKD